jgi:hypothetical protein
MPVAATRYLGTIRDFVMLNALAETPAAPPSRRRISCARRSPAKRILSLGPGGAQFNGDRDVTHDQIREGRRA